MRNPRLTYALDIRQGIPGDCEPPTGEEPKVRTIAAARRKFADAVRSSSLYGESAYATLYFDPAWDGISYGDPIGVFTIGPRGGIRFERY